MRKMIVLILVLLVSSALFAGTSDVKPVVLKEISKPFQLILEGEQMYVVQKEKVYIYSLKDYRLVTQFGKTGEGPKEFRVTPNVNEGNVWIYVNGEEILINSMGRASFFNTKGEYLRENIAPPGLFQPMGKGYMAINFGQRDNVNMYIVNLYDENFKKTKEIYSKKQAFQRTGDIDPYDMVGPLNYVYKDRVYVKGEKGLIHVFDFNGEKKQDIKYDYEKLAITEASKARVYEYYKTNPATKRFYEYIKPRIKFRDHYPTIRWYSVADDKIYVLSYKMKGDKSMFYIFDLDGKFLKTAMAPIEERDAVLVAPYDIRDGKVYQLKENLDKEAIELHIYKL